MEKTDIRPTERNLTENTENARLRNGITTVLIDFKKSGEIRIFERRADLIDKAKNVTPATEEPQS